MTRSFYDQGHAMADQLVSLWHEIDGVTAMMLGLPGDLHTFMGLTWEEYQDFVQGTGAWDLEEIPTTVGRSASDPDPTQTPR